MKTKVVRFVLGTKNLTLKVPLYVPLMYLAFGGSDGADFQRVLDPMRTISLKVEIQKEGEVRLGYGEDRFSTSNSWSPKQT